MDRIDRCADIFQDVTLADMQEKPPEGPKTDVKTLLQQSNLYSLSPQTVSARSWYLHWG